MLSRARLAHLNIENWVRYLLPDLKELGLTIACDIQDLVTLDDPYRQDFINAADILFFSAVNYPDPTPLFEALLDRNPSQILVSGMGSRGCGLATRAGIRFFDPVYNIEGMPVIDTNGAGDGLAVGFLSSYVLEGYSLEDSVMRGQIVARYTCGIKASSTGLINRAQLNYYFSRLPEL
jgi:sugar/nucleoside kinase (ribokinase family)